MDLVTVERYLDVVKQAHNGKLPLNNNQKDAVTHDYSSPLWIVAGPGTGKTHTLSWLVLKRLLVDGISPDRVVLTTFTNKAAAELEFRLMRHRDLLIENALSDQCPAQAESSEPAI